MRGGKDSIPGPPEAAPNAVFALRRERLLERIGDGVVVVGAAPELRKSRDTEILFRQASDLYYLTGFHEPEAVAVISRHADDGPLTLFLRPRDPKREQWAGKRVGVEAAAERFGADAAWPIDKLDERLPEMLAQADHIFYPVGFDAALDHQVERAISKARYTRQRSGRGPTGSTDLEALTGPMRRIKDAHELERHRTACRISAAAHRAAMLAARPGAGEWEIQAALEAEMRRQGAEGPAFPSIVAGGANATVLHYVDNAERVPEDALVLVDAGAEWGMYTGDITRTFPVSGHFTPVQRELYELVLAAEEAAIAAVAPARPVSAVHEAARDVLVRGMVDLGLLGDESVEESIEGASYKTFFMHQTSHWLGLDVHDVGTYAEAGEPVLLEPGMVLTIEPGLYIAAKAEGVPDRYRGIGVRIEDDVVVTDTGHEILTRDVPVAPDEIEALMALRGRVANADG